MLRGGYPSKTLKFPCIQVFSVSPLILLPRNQPTIVEYSNSIISCSLILSPNCGLITSYFLLMHLCSFLDFLGSLGPNPPILDALDLEGGMLGMCYILCMCVCVGVSDTTTASDNPYLCVWVRILLFLADL
jgi:hypothetical protein